MKSKDAFYLKQTKSCQWSWWMQCKHQNPPLLSFIVMFVFTATLHSDAQQN